MASHGYSPDAATKMAFYFGIMPNPTGTAAIVEAVQEYLASWPQERIASLQQADTGWASFDVNRRPLRVYDALDVRCIRDAIHSHRMALSGTGVAMTPEFVELEEFLFLAIGMIANLEQTAFQAQAIRTPAIPSHADTFENHW
jgi:hypothetical protein